MNVPYTPPNFQVQAFNCPHCGAYANQVWHLLGKVNNSRSLSQITAEHVATCGHCQQISVWISGRMVYPASGNAPLPNSDMPEDVKQVYEEARSIATISPRAAAALLRLSVQMLCKHLGEPGENINRDIASLVQKGLPVAVQMALDSVRIVGNGAVHPGEIEFNDDPTIAQKLFAMVNFICDNQITQPKMAAQFFSASVPASAQAAIARRDGNSQ